MQFNKKIKIGHRDISADDPVFLIAELSANHNNDIQRAKDIIEQAALNGADAIKLQTYTADTITLKSNNEEFMIEGGLWDGRSLHDLYSEGSLPWEWHRELIAYAKNLGLVVLSSPFDESAVDFLVSEGIDGLKVASFELNHIPMIEHAAKQGVPLLMSTGMASTEEIKEAVECAARYTDNLILLHCISSYPAEPSDYGLSALIDLQKKFGILVGLSDHCVDNLAASASIALGATVVEKHFTLNRKDGGLDDSFSLEPSGLRDLREKVDIVKQAVAPLEKGCSPCEEGSRKYRRSIYACKPIKQGEVFTQDNIKVVRPSLGLHPRYYPELLGTKSSREIDFAEPLTSDDLDGGAE